ncbi:MULTISPECIES: F0F1 ATP synthase subunit delta [Corynebacterium]|uniref:F0F1 ATP synthase subunit delta n=1 Tax=Corynebacterium TaxID=1716 RepID=UPI0008A5AF78|nr:MULTISPECIES: F0F1 ATP synthase subunit delta [Corynebacterium]MDK6493421.1 F0F1 ATP synthase subunit delta [Corynebacterium coyleae]MDK8663246.1 F0F1 ATP synthase subunit delta [Corynebacterium coyleae]MDK8706408.1 F0F1 ATP synthase subunit delta [Corynebacterium coyleae]MDK8733201.1 F0F1 ATP synthase subunit delta [Corynebacterium coyleae]MDK8892450.1 F0F1 ATP synthase subunit delta [Corynebacterium coyleae]
MKAASREAQSHVTGQLESLIGSADNAVATAAQIGTELFLIVDQLDTERALRVAIADTSLEPGQRAGMVKDVFGGKVAEPTLNILTAAAEQEWSTPREFRAGLINLGRIALQKGAQEQGQLEQVENELYQLSVLLEDEKELTQLLSDRTATAAQKRGLLASVIYGKVTMFTEALALQVIGRPHHNPVDDLAELAENVAEMRGKSVARVKTAEALNDTQRDALARKLEQIYGREIAIHSEVDPSLLGGMVVRVGDEVIDGSTRGKIERLRTDMAAQAAK